MIGGHDIILPLNGHTPYWAVNRAAASTITKEWPSAVFEDMRDKDSSLQQEALVYRTEEDRQLVEALGITPDTSGQVIHLLADEKELTVVVHDPDDPQIKEILSGIRRRLEPK